MFCYFPLRPYSNIFLVNMQIHLIFLQVASFGGYLLTQNILTMSFAPRDSHKSQIQFALERGIPAFVAMLGTRRLPFPAFGFDLVHCSRCLIPFTAYSKLLIASRLCLSSSLLHACHFHNAEVLPCRCNLFHGSG